MSVPGRANDAQDDGMTRSLSRIWTHALINITENQQLHRLVDMYSDMLIQVSQETRALSDSNIQYARAYADLASRFNILYNHTTQLSDTVNQLEQENDSLRRSCFMTRSPLVGRSPFSLQHPNNVHRAQVLRRQQPRFSRVESLREPGGGLGMGTRAPAPAAAQGGMQAQEGLYGAVGDRRSSSSGQKQAGAEKEDSDAGSGPGPTVVDEEEDEKMTER
jgi:hypothetical protein